MRRYISLSRLPFDRVDAQQMISNAGIQKRAKEKIVHLNHTVTALYD